MSDHIARLESSIDEVVGNSSLLERPLHWAIADYDVDQMSALEKLRGD